MKYLPLTIAVFISLVMFSSCAKPTNTETTIYDTVVLHDTPSTNSPYYIKATINGINVTYNGYTAAVNVNVGGLVLYGYNNDAINTTDGITLRIDNSASGGNIPVGIGTYTDTANHNYGITNHTWNPYTATMTSQQFGTDYVTVVFDDTITGATPFTAIITAINDSSVSGTFSGAVYYGFSPGAPLETETITNGSFYVPF
ncbi:MAG TPA: hypothetical protein VK718_01885 [Ferruginibacter sp.]|jgi:hypothetical protein|nr:hypothetical protein [Ferruginibacter sp.]